MLLWLFAKPVYIFSKFKSEWSLPQSTVEFKVSGNKQGEPLHHLQNALRKPQPNDKLTELKHYFVHSAVWFCFYMFWLNIEIMTTIKNQLRENPKNSKSQDSSSNQRWWEIVALCDCAVMSPVRALMRLKWGQCELGRWDILTRLRARSDLPQQRSTVYLLMCHWEMCPCT